MFRFVKDVLAEKRSQIDPMSNVDVWLNAFQRSLVRLELTRPSVIVSQASLLDRAMEDVMTAVDGWIEPLSVDLAFGESLADDDPALGLQTAGVALAFANLRVPQETSPVALESNWENPHIAVVERIDLGALHHWARRCWDDARSGVPKGRVGWQSLDLASWRVQLPPTAQQTLPSTVVARGGQIGEGDNPFPVERRSGMSWVAGSGSFFALGMSVSNAYGNLQLDIDPRWSWWSGKDSFGHPCTDESSIEGRRSLNALLEKLVSRGWTMSSSRNTP